MDRSLVEGILEQLAHSLGSSALRLDENDAVGLRIDEVVLGLQFDAQRERFLVYCDLGPLPQGSDRPKTLQALLQTSLFGRATAGGALSLTAESTPRIVLWRAIDAPALDARRLEQAVREVATAAHDWLETLKGKVPMAPSSAPALDFTRPGMLQA